jgi:hypothetical protein
LKTEYIDTELKLNRPKTVHKHARRHTAALKNTLPHAMHSSRLLALDSHAQLLRNDRKAYIPVGRL